MKLLTPALLVGLFVFTPAGISQTTVTQPHQVHRSTQVQPLCIILNDAANYDGKLITVRGFYVKWGHGPALVWNDPENNCCLRPVNIRAAKGERQQKEAASVIKSYEEGFDGSVDEVVRGTFHVAHNGNCFGQDCLAYEIDVTDLLSAHLMPTVTFTFQ